MHLALLCGVMVAVSDQLQVLKLVTGLLDANGLGYMLTGSIAAGLYGQPRMTRDIDIVAVLYPPHARQLEDLLTPDFICDTDTIRDAVASRRMFSVVHRAALQKVDFIVRTDEDYELEKFERRRQIVVDDQPMWVISPEDLILSKLAWSKDSRSELQLRDVRNVITIQENLDWLYIERWALRLTVAGLLKEVRG